MMEKKEFNRAAKDIASTLRSELKATVPERTGRLRRSIKAEVSESQDGTSITIEAEEYIRFLPAAPSIRMTARPSSFQPKKDGLLQKFEEGAVKNQLSSPKLSDAYANDAEKAILKSIDKIFKS